MERVLTSPQTSQEVLRQTVVVVENLTKLVHDPVEAREFLPRLQPGVKRVEDTATLPQVRELAHSANAVMEKAMHLSSGAAATDKIGERISVQEVKDELALKVAPSIKKEEITTWEKKIAPYVAAMARETIVIREWSRLSDCIAPYLRDLLTTGEEGAK